MKRSNQFFGFNLWTGTPYLIAILLLCIGLRAGGFYGFYINGDGKGYYAYLPATFIYHDFTFDFTRQTEPKYYPKGAVTEFRKEVQGAKVNKYFVGTALLWLPFFLLAHIVSLILGMPADGYAPLYQYSVLIAAIFYLWLGLFYLRKLLLAFHFKELHILLIQLLVVFASPLIFYTIFNPDWTHLYSFTLITIFLYCIKQYFENRQASNLTISWILLGLIVLVRPINGMVIFALPFIAGSAEKLKDTVVCAVHQYKSLIIGFVLFVLILFTQCVFYFLETGHWLIWSYAGEGFNFLKPHFVEVLFSYRRGLFIYTPFTFLCLVGFILLFRQSIFQALSLMLFLVFVIYALSSWHCWSYGMCFSLRPITEYLPFFAILLGYSFQLRMGSVFRIMFSLALAFTVLYNSVQLWQYKHYIQNWDNMDRESFWRVFFRTSSEYLGVVWTSPEPIFEKRPDGVKSDTLAVFDFEKSNLEYITDKTAHSGKYSMLLHKKNPLSPGINDSCKNVMNADSACFYVSAYICPLNRFYSRSLHLIFSVQDSVHFFQYQKIDFDLYHIRTGEWVKIGRTIKSGAVRSPNDIVKIYLHNTSNFKVCVDDLTIERLR